MSVLRDQYEEKVRRFAQLLEQRNIDEWIELYAEDGANHCPFNSIFGNSPDVIGKQEVLAAWKDFPSLFDSCSLTLHAIYVDEEQRTAIFRMDSHHVWAGGRNEWTGEEYYDNQFICVIRFNETGQILDYQEYYNAIVTGASFGLVEVKARPAEKR
jgi:ketosteroid isomerase-like protein